MGGGGGGGGGGGPEAVHHPVGSLFKRSAGRPSASVYYCQLKPKNGEGLGTRLPTPLAHLHPDTSHTSLAHLHPWHISYTSPQHTYTPGTALAHLHLQLAHIIHITPAHLHPRHGTGTPTPPAHLHPCPPTPLTHLHPWHTTPLAHLHPWPTYTLAHLHPWQKHMNLLLWGLCKIQTAGSPKNASQKRNGRLW